MPEDDDLLTGIVQPARRARPTAPDYNEIIERHSMRTGLDSNLVRAIMNQESGGNPRAVSPKGARGPMQLMPATAHRFNVTDSHDPEQAIRGGTDYLKFLSDRYKGNRDLILAGYNAGEGAVDKYGGIPPFRETRNYVRSISQKLGGASTQQPTRQDDDLLSGVVADDLSSGVVEPTVTKPVTKAPKPSPLTTNDTEWHFGEYLPKPSRRALQVLREARAEDDRKRAAGQTEFTRSPSYQAEMRKRAGLQPQSTTLAVSRNVGYDNPYYDDEKGVRHYYNTTEELDVAIAKRGSRAIRQLNQQIRSQPQPTQPNTPRQLDRDAQIALSKEEARAAMRETVRAEFEDNRLAMFAQSRGTDVGLLKMPITDYDVEKETEKRLQERERRGEFTPEFNEDVRQSRLEQGRMSAPERVVSRPLQGFTARAVKMAAGIMEPITWISSDAKRAQDFMNMKASVAEIAAHSEPLNSLDQEIKRGIPEKIATGVGELGVGIGELVLMKKATGLSMATIMGTQTFLQTSDQPMKTRLEQAAHSAAMGKVLDQHLSKSASAVLFGAPALAQGLSNKDSLEDVIINTAVQAGAGLVLGGKREGSGEIGRRRNVSSRTRLNQGDTQTKATDEPAFVPEAGQARAETNRPLYSETQQAEVVINARQTETQRQGVQAEQPAVQVPVPPKREVAIPKQQADQGSNVRTPLEQPQRFQHLQFGEVEVTQSQQGARAGKLRVAEVANPEAIHYVRKADLRGRGNERMVPLKQETETPSVTEKVAELGREGEVSRIQQKHKSLLAKYMELDAQRDKAHPEKGREERWNLSQEITKTAAELYFAKGGKYFSDFTRNYDTPTNAKEHVGKMFSEKFPELAEKYGVKPSPQAEAVKPETLRVEPERVTDGPRREFILPKGDEVTQPLAAEGFTSYRYRPESGGQHVAIGAKDHADALSEAGRSLSREKPDISRLDVWDGEKYVPASKPETTSVEQGIEPRRETPELINAVPQGTQMLLKFTRKEGAVNDTDLKALFPEYHVTVERKYNALTPEFQGVTLTFWNKEGTRQVKAPEDAVQRFGLVKTFYAGQEPELAYGTEASAQIKSPKTPEQIVDPAPVIPPKIVEQSARPPVDRTAGEGAGIQGTPAKETVPAPSTTAAKKASFAADREVLDLPELPPAERKGWQTSLDNAKAKELDRQAGYLADEVLRRPRALNDEETAGMVLRAQQIKNELAIVRAEIVENPDPQKIARSESLQNEFNTLTKAVKLSGTEKGRTLAAQKLTINQDYDLTSVVQRMTEAKGRKLTTDEVAKFERMVAERDTAIKERDAALERAHELELQKQITKASRQRKRGETKATLDEEAVAIKANIIAELARLKSQQSSVQSAFGLGNLDPEGVLTRELLKYARNRVKANVSLKAEALIDEIHDLVRDSGATRRQVSEMMAGYGVHKGTGRSDAVKQLADIRSEITRLLKAEDISEGRRSPSQEGPQRYYRRNEQRLKNLRKQEAEYQRRLDEQDFTPKQKPDPVPYTREVTAAERRVKELEVAFKRAEYKARRSVGGKITDELAKAANVPKTIKSMGDISAVFRQGGYYAITHPYHGLVRPFHEMVRAFSETGEHNVRRVMERDPDYRELKEVGKVEFTGEKGDPHLDRHEEGFLGREYLDYIPVARQISRFSERTFTTFLDAQRLYVGKVLKRGLIEPGIVARTLGAKQGLSPAEYRDNLQRIGKAINSATGRGNLGAKGNQIAPVLNIAMFSPRLLKSRVELLNNMLNPVAIARMPRNARAQIIQDNVKFLAATMGVMALAKSLGGEVNTDPDDGDFLKIRFGSTTYDMLTGLQQPLRFIMRMGLYGGNTWGGAIRGGDTYSGENMLPIIGRFARSKASPALTPLIDFAAGSDFEGRKFSAKREALDVITPLPSKDVIEAMQKEGLIGALKATPTFVGVGVQSYDKPAEEAKTHAEKLSRKLAYGGLPEKARTDEEIERSRELSQLRARSRAGEDVTAELDKLKPSDKQRQGILDAKGATRLQEDFKHLDIKQALTVYRVATREEQQQLRDVLETKANNAMEKMSPDEQADLAKRLEAIGMKQGERKRPMLEMRERKPQRRNSTSYQFQQ